MITVSIGVGIWLIAKGPSVPPEQIVSRNGLHWHPFLTIIIKGEKQKIPANIGLGAIPKEIHTHDDTGKIHLELREIVTKDEIKLKEFFKNWDKQFSSTCIFEHCNGENGTVKMSVNGQPSDAFENYEMHDGDQIEIRYE